MGTNEVGAQVLDMLQNLAGDCQKVADRLRETSALKGNGAPAAENPRVDSEYFRQRAESYEQLARQGHGQEINNLVFDRIQNLAHDCRRIGDLLAETEG